MPRITRRTLMAALPALAAVTAASAATAATEQWGLHEIALEGPSGGNPFVDITLSAQFSQGTTTLTVPGFYDGEGVYRLRFSPPTQGLWRWRTTSNAPALSGKSGEVSVSAPKPGDHGPVGVVAGYHFAYADGTPFRQIGTTAYAWAQQSDALCEETLATLAASPFNKIRMCVIQNVPAEPIWPFEKIGPGDRDWNYDRFNPAFFRRFEDRIARLKAIGVQADVIFFHPYDELRGFDAMTAERDDRYVRYVVARLSAYNNVWWSMANEYDLVKAKTVADFDRLLQLVQTTDPHGRLRSIHNWRELYDNGKPWITHSSVQDGSAVLNDTTAEKYRSVWKKPVIFDEVRYEGNIDKRWGNLSPELAVAGFWHALVAGTYVGHGEAYKLNAAGSLWVGRGGSLIGPGQKRIAFYKSALDAGPSSGFEPIDKWWEQHLGGKQGEYYLRYFDAATPASWDVDLPKDGLTGGERFAIDLLDTWNMTVTPVEGSFVMAKKNGYYFHDPARPSIALPGKPWMAVRVKRLPA